MTGTITKPVRVVVVDDSALMRELVCKGFRLHKNIEVVASCADSIEARAAIKKYKPEVVTLDVEMPGMNGLDFLEKIMQHRPMPVIMVSTLTRNGAETSLRALELGAVDVVEKPVGRGGLESFICQLVKLVLGCRGLVFEDRVLAENMTAFRHFDKVPVKSNSPVSLVAIGSSTGGVAALQQVLKPLPTKFPPIVVTQHMPKKFVERFVSRLAVFLNRNVNVAMDNSLLEAGKLYFASGDAHLTVVSENGELRARLLKAEPVSGHIPSVDVMFESIAQNVGKRAVGVILTGMGRDGASGLRSMKNTGALCLGQNKDSCVVYGMPRAAREIEAIHEELSLEEIPVRICQFLNEYSATKYKSSIGAK